MNKLFSFMGTIGLGAGLMYLYDPDRGNRRRAMIRDQATSFLNSTDSALEKTARDLRNRSRGFWAETVSMFTRGEAPDWIIMERVRAEIGRVSRHSSAIEVHAYDGQVTLRGPVLADEVDRILSHITRVRGVKGVVNQLEVHQTAGDIPALQGNAHRREPKFELAQENWSPTARVLTGAGGTALAIYGMSRRGLVGTAVSLLGLGLAARGVTNIDFKRLIGAGGGRKAIDIQKTINIAAPVEEVFNFWANFENFPRFMSHVREIKGDPNGVSHWVVAGPAGIPVEWNAVLTEKIPNQVIAWKSLPEEAVKSAGIVQFQQNPGGGTRVTVRMTYNPPAGALGHVVASLFGANPKHVMDEDLVRLKSLLETGKTTAAGQEITRRNLAGATGTAG